MENLSKWMNTMTISKISPKWMNFKNIMIIICNLYNNNKTNNINFLWIYLKDKKKTILHRDKEMKYKVRMRVSILHKVNLMNLMMKKVQ